MQNQQKHVRLFSCCSIAMILLATVSCETSSTDYESQAISADVATAEITVEVADRAGYDAVLAGLRGNVVLVDFWATWCPPCVASFPHTVQMSRNYADSQFKVVSVSLDDPDQKSEVLEFLRSQGATFDNLISAHGTSPKSITDFEITNGAVPHYKIYDKSGQVRYTFTGHSDELDVRVRELFAESG